MSSYAEKQASESIHGTSDHTGRLASQSFPTCSLQVTLQRINEECWHLLNPTQMLVKGNFRKYYFHWIVTTCAMQIQLQNKVCTPPLLARLLTPSTHSIKKIRNHHWLASVTLLYLLPQINCVTEKYNIVELDLVQQTSLHSPLGGRKNWAPGRWRGMLGFIKRVTREAHIQTPGLPASSPLPASTTQLSLGHFCLPTGSDSEWQEYMWTERWTNVPSGQMFTLSQPTVGCGWASTTDWPESRAGPACAGSRAPGETAGLYALGEAQK